LDIYHLRKAQWAVVLRNRCPIQKESELEKVLVYTFLI
jgi:hypothetical protein